MPTCSAPRVRRHDAKPILPCASCLDPAGWLDRNGRPGRSPGERFGFPPGSRICHKCVRRMRKCVLLGRSAVAGDPDASAAACAGCGTTGGYTQRAARMPARHSGERYGFPAGSKLCQACRTKAVRDRRATGLATTGGAGDVPDDKEVWALAAAMRADEIERCEEAERARTKAAEVDLAAAARRAIAEARACEARRMRWAGRPIDEPLPSRTA
jgi:hypothetical protein